MCELALGVGEEVFFYYLYLGIELVLVVCLLCDD